MVNSAAAYWYPILRQEGHLYLNPDQVSPTMVSAMRRSAKRQGLRILVRKTRGSAITDVWLLSATGPALVVRPDAQVL